LMKWPMLTLCSDTADFLGWCRHVSLALLHTSASLQTRQACWIGKLARALSHGYIIQHFFFTQLLGFSLFPGCCFVFLENTEDTWGRKSA
jgi:hypothetical protein